MREREKKDYYDYYDYYYDDDYDKYMMNEIASVIKLIFILLLDLTYYTINKTKAKVN
jgi:hypothetical protein